MQICAPQQFLHVIVMVPLFFFFTIHFEATLSPSTAHLKADGIFLFSICTVTDDASSFYQSNYKVMSSTDKVRWIGAAHS